MTLPTLSPGPVESKGMWPAVLPWNTTVTMADVWSAELVERRRIANQRLNARVRRVNAELRTEADQVADRDRQRRFLADYQRRHSNLSDDTEASNA